MKNKKFKKRVPKLTCQQAHSQITKTGQDLTDFTNNRQNIKIFVNTEREGSCFMQVWIRAPFFALLFLKIQTQSSSPFTNCSHSFVKVKEAHKIICLLSSFCFISCFHTKNKDKMQNTRLTPIHSCFLLVQMCASRYTSANPFIAEIVSSRFGYCMFIFCSWIRTS